MAVFDFRNSDLFTDAETAALELAEAMSNTPVTVSDDLFLTIQKHFSEPQIVEMAALIALENWRSRFNRCFGITDQGLYEKSDEVLKAALN